MKVEVVTPEEYMGDVMGDLNSPPRYRVRGLEELGNAQERTFEREVPLGRDVRVCDRFALNVTQGRATYTMEFAKYAEAPSNIAESVIKKAS